MLSYTQKKGKECLRKKINSKRKNMDLREIIAKFFFPWQNTNKNIDKNPSEFWHFPSLKFEEFYLKYFDRRMKYGKVCFPLTEHQSKRLFLDKTFQNRSLFLLPAETRMSRKECESKKLCNTQAICSKLLF